MIIKLKPISMPFWISPLIWNRQIDKSYLDFYNQSNNKGLTNHKVIEDFFSKYIKAISNNNIDNLKEFLEPRFY